VKNIAILHGTVNDATTFPPPSPMHGSYHWAFERLLSAALVPMTAAAFVTSGSSHAILDGVLAVTLVMHTHIGVSALFIWDYSKPIVLIPILRFFHQFDSSVTDYVHIRKFPVIGQFAKWGLRTATLATLVGVYQFNTNDVGKLCSCYSAKFRM
jgi:succinate dehydrogenase (ubiquinone) membrane anchor subunit